MLLCRVCLQYVWWSGTVSDVIDLTGDDKDDLQRAIALSLEESSRAFRETGITDEEQDISRFSTPVPVLCLLDTLPRAFETPILSP